jgi:hypothetical protein
MEREHRQYGALLRGPKSDITTVVANFDRAKEADFQFLGGRSGMGSTPSLTRVLSGRLYRGLTAVDRRSTGQGERRVVP